MDLNLRKELVGWYTWIIDLYCAETFTIQEVNEKQLESFEMLCCRGMEKIRQIMWEVRMCQGGEEYLINDKNKD